MLQVSEPVITKMLVKWQLTLFRLAEGKEQEFFLNLESYGFEN